MARKTGSIGLGEIEREYAGVSLGDARLEERLRRIVALAAMAPSDSFPEQMGSVADREALYRFFSNPRVTVGRLLAAHVQQTRARLAGQRQIRILHDTSKFRFDGERQGLGILKYDTKGFLGHFALAVSADEAREPLGVLGMHPYIHKDAVAHRGLTSAERTKIARKKPRSAKESSRWENLAIQVSALLPDGVRALHIMDQEADDYDLLAEMQRAKLAFVIRGDAGRRESDGEQSVTEVLAKQPGRLFRTVPINARSKRRAALTRGRFVARYERNAELKIRWGQVTFRRRYYSHTKVRELSVHAVHVFEPRPPKGEEPIEWMLLTSESVNNLTEATAIVDHYRARWLIEEYFKALKTGCSIERRQLMTLDGLLRALAFFVPMAWRLLLLRHLGRAAKQPLAQAVLDREQLLLLRRLLATRNYSFPDAPTVRDVMLGMAALGGHIKNNGDPGWIVLGRGFTRFVEAETVWRLAREGM